MSNLPELFVEVWGRESNYKEAIKRATTEQLVALVAFENNEEPIPEKAVAKAAMATWEAVAGFRHTTSKKPKIEMNESKIMDLIQELERRAKETSDEQEFFAITGVLIGAIRKEADNSSSVCLGMHPYTLTFAQWSLYAIRDIANSDWAGHRKLREAVNSLVKIAQSSCDERWEKLNGPVVSALQAIGDNRKTVRAALYRIVYTRDECEPFLYVLIQRARIESVNYSDRDTNQLLGLLKRNIRTTTRMAVLRALGNRYHQEPENKEKIAEALFQELNRKEAVVVMNAIQIGRYLCPDGACRKVKSKIYDLCQDLSKDWKVIEAARSASKTIRWAIKETSLGKWKHLAERYYRGVPRASVLIARDLGVLQNPLTERRAGVPGVRDSAAFKGRQRQGTPRTGTIRL